MSTYGYNPELINLDRIEKIINDECIPEWAFWIIEKYDADIIDVSGITVSESGDHKSLKLRWPHKPRGLHPLTVFCLLQWLAGENAENGDRYFTIKQIRDQHIKNNPGYEYKFSEKTYSRCLNKLMFCELVYEHPDGWGIPSDRTLAPAFDPDNTNNKLDKIVVDPPAGSTDERLYSTWWPLVDRLRQPTMPVSFRMTGSLGADGFMFATSFFGLAVIYADLVSVETITANIALVGVLWGLISLGIAGMIVWLLGDLRIRYETATAGR